VEQTRLSAAVDFSPGQNQRWASPHALPLKNRPFARRICPR
jgi:hypothetical protein